LIAYKIPDECRLLPEPICTAYEQGLLRISPSGTREFRTPYVFLIIMFIFQWCGRCAKAGLCSKLCVLQNDIIRINRLRNWIYDILECFVEPVATFARNDNCNNIFGKALATLTVHTNEYLRGKHNLKFLQRPIPWYVGPTQDNVLIWVYDRAGQPYCSRFITQGTVPPINMIDLLAHYLEEYYLFPEGTTHTSIYAATEILR
jgi:hypothetical protein